MATFSALGSEFRVNSTTANIQFNSSVAGLSGGGFAVVWTSATASGNDIRGQIYNAGGVAVGGELSIATLAGLNESAAEVSALGTGFVVAYEAPNAPLFHPNSVWTEVFDASGAGTGEIEAETGGNQNHIAVVAASTAGGYVTLWEETGLGPDTDNGLIRGGASGGGGLTINTTTAGHQAGPSIAALQDGTGRYVAAWTENDFIGSTNVLRGQFLDAAGGKSGSEFVIDNDVFSPNNADMEIAARPGAGYAIAFTDLFRTHIKVFGAANNLLSDFEANPGALPGEDEAAMTVLSNGLIAVAGRDFNNGGFSHLRVFAPDGTQVGTEILLQAGAGSGIIADPSIAALSGGQFVVTWTDNRATLGDADHGITGQRFQTAATALVNGTEGDDVFNGVTLTGLFMGYLGFDTVTYATAAAGVTINLASPNLNTGTAAGDEFGNSIELIIGSNLADTMAGDGRGNSFQGGGGGDTLDGGAGDDVLNGGAANDTLNGGVSGSDTADYSTASALVSVNLNLAGAQNTGVSTGSDTLINIDNLRGSNFNDTLVGDGNANILDGGLGDDAMTGGSGDDIYVLDSAADATVEALNAGIDTTRASITHALRVNIENLVLTGTSNINGTGNALGNGITGNSGDNVLNGLTGADTMTGAAGNDTYWADNIADAAVETAGQGIDIVQASIDFTLNAEVEKLYLRPGAVNGAGNALSNFIYGNNAANTLDGKAGADRLNGSNGDDLYIVDSTGDLIFETSAAGGTDTVQSSVNHTLATNVENLTLTGAGNVNATGNTQANVIVGNGGNNFIDGKLGSDTLTGGLGIDQFLFTTALGAANIDTIAGFSVPSDTIRLENAIFTGLAVGYLAASQFTIGAAAADASDRIVYNSATGALLFDADGSGAGAAKQFAAVGTGLALTASDFYVF